jgi:hypothetical protein
MAMRFDTIQVFKFIDFDTDEEFQYFAFYDSGDDYTSPPEYLEKFNSDDSYQELSTQLNQLRTILWNN